MNPIENHTVGRRFFSAVALLLPAFLAAGSHHTSSRAADPPDRPNIVIFLADDLGWKDVGFHGSKIKTPNLDKLAASGVRMEQFYVQPVCSPTRAALMTGKYPIRLGLQVGVIRPWADYGLPLEEKTLAARLQAAGYSTAITGKWHLGAHATEFLPHRRGFDHEYGHYLGMIDYFTHMRNGGLDWHRNGKALREEGYTTELIAQEAADVVQRYDASQPLFLYVPFNAPHTPLQAPDEYLAKYRRIEDEKRLKFAAMVDCLDAAVGKVIAALEKKQMQENTLILFFSDNGGPTRHGANNGALRGGKGSLYEGGVRVPALAAWPGKLKAGRMEKGLMHVVDLFPTLLSAAGVELSAEDAPLLDGQNQLPTLAGKRPSPRKEILHNLTPAAGAVRQGDWKLVVRGRNRPKLQTVELFNIAVDPNEKTDVAEKQPEILKALTARLEHYAAAAAPHKTTGAQPPQGFTTPKVWGETGNLEN